jgi:hypothetical protein
MQIVGRTVQGAIMHLKRAISQAGTVTVQILLAH